MSSGLSGRSMVLQSAVSICGWGQAVGSPDRDRERNSVREIELPLDEGFSRFCECSEGRHDREFFDMHPPLKNVTIASFWTRLFGIRTVHI